MKRYEQMSIPPQALQMPEDWNHGYEAGFKEGWLKARKEALQLAQNPIRPINVYGDLTNLVLSLIAQKIENLGEEENEICRTGSSS